MTHQSIDDADGGDEPADVGGWDHDPPDHGDTAGGASDAGIQVDPDTGVDRATGIRENDDPSEGIWGGSLGGGEDDALGLLGDKETSTDYHLLGDDPGKLLAESLGIQPGERVSEWVDQDCEQSRSSSESFFEIVAAFFAGISDFLQNKKEMETVGVKGGDKFFHCRANCQAAGRGWGGLLAAKMISYGREVTDAPKNVVVHGMTWTDSLDDCASDMKANRVGQDAGSNGLRCYDACIELVPESSRRYLH